MVAAVNNHQKMAVGIPSACYLHKRVPHTRNEWAQLRCCSSSAFRRSSAAAASLAFRWVSSSLVFPRVSGVLVFYFMTDDEPIQCLYTRSLSNGQNSNIFNITVCVHICVHKCAEYLGWIDTSNWGHVCTHKQCHFGTVSNGMSSRHAAWWLGSLISGCKQGIFWTLPKWAWQRPKSDVRLTMLFAQDFVSWCFDITQGEQQGNNINTNDNNGRSL